MAAYCETTERTKQIKMETVFEFTRSELAEAFLRWGKDVENNPEKYGDIKATLDCAERQADELLINLQEVKK